MMAKIDLTEQTAHPDGPFFPAILMWNHYACRLCPPRRILESKSFLLRMRISFAKQECWYAIKLLLLVIAAITAWRTFGLQAGEFAAGEETMRAAAGLGIQP